MIKLQNYTPTVYYDESRDFQFIGRLYDLVLNYSKTNADLLYALPLSDNSDDQFIELLSLTLGFRAKHKYTAKHLRAVCSVFSEVLRNKGTIKALLLVCGAIFNAECINKSISYEMTDDNTNFTLFIPPELKDTTLLLDIFSYIMPAGLSCNIIKLVEFKNNSTTQLEAQDTFKLYKVNDNSAYNDNALAILGADVKNATRLIAADTAGLLMHSTVYKPENSGE